MAEEERVEFVPNSKTTIYADGSNLPYRPGTTVMLPKEHAEALDHLHVKHEIAAGEKAKVEAAKVERKQTRADAPKVEDARAAQ